MLRDVPDGAHCFVDANIFTITLSVRRRFLTKFSRFFDALEVFRDRVTFFLTSCHMIFFPSLSYLSR